MNIRCSITYSMSPYRNTLCFMFGRHGNTNMRTLFIYHADTAIDTRGAYLLFVRNRSDGADVEAALRC